MRSQTQVAGNFIFDSLLEKYTLLFVLKIICEDKHLSIYWLFRCLYSMNCLSRPHLILVGYFSFWLIYKNFAFIDTLPGIYVAIFFFQMCHLS